MQKRREHGGIHAEVTEEFMRAAVLRHAGVTSRLGGYDTRLISTTPKNSDLFVVEFLIMCFAKIGDIEPQRSYKACVSPVRKCRNELFGKVKYTGQWESFRYIC